MNVGLVPIQLPGLPSGLQRTLTNQGGSTIFWGPSNVSSLNYSGSIGPGASITLQSSVKNLYVVSSTDFGVLDDIVGVIPVIDPSWTKTFYAGDPSKYGVKADGRTLTDCSITSGQAVVSSASYKFTQEDVNKLAVFVLAGAGGTAHLYSRIKSVQNGLATLNNSAVTTVSNTGEFVFGTDDTAISQQCLTDAAAVGGTAIYPEGDICISAPIVAPGAQTVSVQGVSPVKELFGGTTQNNDANFPTIAPYLKGTVFVQCSPNLDGMQMNAQGVGHHLKWVGIRFAGRYLTTGHGVTTVPTGGKLGNMGGVFEDVRVFGHDGNHYGHVIDSPLYMRWAGLRSYGGGGIWLKTNATAPGPPGNITSIDTLSYTYIGGSAHGFSIDCSAGQYFDYCNFDNAEHIVTAPVPALPGVSVPTSAQQCLATTYSAAHPTMLCMGFVNPCMETNVNSTSTFPLGPGCYRTNDPALSAVANAAMTGSPANGAATQNLVGKPMIVMQEFVLQPATAATASTTTTAVVGSGSTSIPVVSSAGFAVGQGIQVGSNAGSDLEFAIVATVPDGTHITVTTPGNFGLEGNHVSGVTVAAGAAVLYAQTASVNSFPSSFRWARYGKAIGDNAEHISFNFPLPSAWFYRLDWANASRQWTDYTGSFG